MQTSNQDDLQRLLERQAHEQATKRADIIAGYGSFERYIDALELCDIVGVEATALSVFYDLYRKVFTLAEEREPLEGFEAVLALNADSEVQSAYGPFCEQISFLRDPATGQAVGATNQVLYAYSHADVELYGYAASCQLNYICVDSALRGMGIAAVLLKMLEQKLHNYAARHGYSGAHVFITCEQNNPHRMNEEQLEEDLRSALIDPQARLDWWRRRGYRKLDFPYVQPPLSADVEPCNYLDYYIRTLPVELNDARFLPSPLLLEHLRRFFFVSVGKLKIDMEDNREWQAQRDFLATRTQISIGP